MAIDYIPEDDDDEDNPLDLAPPEDAPQPEVEEMSDERLTEIVRGIINTDIEELKQSTQTEERLTEIVRGIIIMDVQKLMQSVRACNPSLGENRGFDANTVSSSREVIAFAQAEQLSRGEPSTEITVDNGNNGDTSFPQEDPNKGSNHGKGESSALSDLDKLWMDKIFVLCSLASTEKYAGLLVENHVLEMISAALEASISTIITGACLTLLTDLTSQEGIGKSIASTEGLIKAIVEQLFLDDDDLCLCPTLRLLIFGLCDIECFEWVKALHPRCITRRLFWITENPSAESVLVVELFLTILQSEKRKPAVLIPSLISQGLAKLLTSVLAREIGKLYGESTFPERYRPILNVILQAIKMLSVMELDSNRITFSNRLIELFCDLVRYPNTIKNLGEVRRTAAVLLGDALVDKPHLTTDLSRDLQLFRGLLNAFIDAQKDREELWKVLSHILVHIDEREMGTSALNQYVSLLADQSTKVVYNLMGCRRDPPSEHQSTSTSESSNAEVTSLRRIVSLLREWSRRNADGTQRDSEEEYMVDEESIRELLEDCEIRLKDMAG